MLDAVLQSDSSIANAVLQYEVALQHPENKAALEQAYDRWGLCSISGQSQTVFLRQKQASICLLPRAEIMAPVKQ